MDSHVTAYSSTNTYTSASCATTADKSGGEHMGWMSSSHFSLSCHYLPPPPLLFHSLHIFPYSLHPAASRWSRQILKSWSTSEVTCQAQQKLDGTKYTWSTSSPKLEGMHSTGLIWWLHLWIRRPTYATKDTYKLATAQRTQLEQQGQTEQMFMNIWIQQRDYLLLAFLFI